MQNTNMEEAQQDLLGLWRETGTLLKATYS